jgi:DNA repair protein RadA/Sms
VRPEAPRIAAALPELDRVTGGGFVRGSVILIGGDPGIGKSTLLMQACAALASQGYRTVCISAQKPRLRSGCAPSGLAFPCAPVELAAQTAGGGYRRRHCHHGAAPRLVVIDSIQTMWTEAVEAAPGTVTQVRGSAQALIRYAETSGACPRSPGRAIAHQGLGQIARSSRGRAHGSMPWRPSRANGTHHFRILRAVKNPASRPHGRNLASSR